MDPNTPIVLPANWLALYQILANPVTFGVLISMLWEASPWIQSTAVASWKKMLAIVISCLVWAVAITALNPAGVTLNMTTLYNVLLLTFTVTFSTQVWHLVVSPLIEQIIEILFGIGANLKARAVRIDASISSSKIKGVEIGSRG